MVTSTVFAGTDNLAFDEVCQNRSSRFICISEAYAPAESSPCEKQQFFSPVTDKFWGTMHA